MAARKKKRTPAQIRATKKLVALNKKRRSKKRVTKKRVAKKRVVRRNVAKKRTVKRKARKKVKRKVSRKSNPSKGLYYIMIKNKRTGKEGYYSGQSFDTSISKAILSRNKSTMVKLAKEIKVNRSQWHVYVGSK